MRREVLQLLPLGFLAAACVAIALLSAPYAEPAALVGAQVSPGFPHRSKRLQSQRCFGVRVQG